MIEWLLRLLRPRLDEAPPRGDIDADLSAIRSQQDQARSLMGRADAALESEMERRARAVQAEADVIRRRIRRDGQQEASDGVPH